MILFAASAKGQEPLSEQVTVTGHAEDVLFQSLARDVVVLTREQIAALPVRSIADVLALTAGVDVRSRGAWGVQTDFSLRGGACGQTLVLVDGVRLNDAQSGPHNGDIAVPLDEINGSKCCSGRARRSTGPTPSAARSTSSLGRRDRTGRRRSAAASTATPRDPARSPDRGTAFASRWPSRPIARRGSKWIAIFARATSARRRTSTTVSACGVSYLDKSFGANGFYGPAQSTERTNQTLVSADGALRGFGGWSGQWQTAYRTHGDTFTYDRPSRSGAATQEST
jgi:iron complex outermembrane receptor protein